MTKIGEVWDTMPVTDKQNPFPLKKVALRELPNESKNIITTPPRNNLPLKSKGVSPESTKIIGTKRQTPDNPTSPSTYQQSNTSANRHLVYVRRKLENEQGKISTCTNVESVDSPESKIIRKDGKAEQNLQNDQRDEPKVASFPVLWPLQNSMFTTGAPVQADPPRPSNQDWKERFIHLQIFLKNCDQSSQEDYIRSKLLS